MIQKISFTSKYSFIKNRYDHQKYTNQEVNITRSLQSQLSNLKDGDSITISRKKERLIMDVPKYMDSDVETFCIYSGVDYEKEY